MRMKLVSVEAIGENPSYVMSDLQLQTVIAAAKPEFELIMDVTGCIKLVKERTSPTWQAARLLAAKR